MKTSRFFLLLSYAIVCYVSAQENGNECQCWIVKSERRPCPAGGYLPEDTCRSFGCCSEIPGNEDFPTIFTSSEVESTLTCFAPLRKCHAHKQCRVEPEKRLACARVFWRATKRMCQLRGCCYDETLEPFCFRALSSYSKGPLRSLTTDRPPTSSDPVRDYSLKPDQAPLEPLFEVMKKQLKNLKESVAFKASVGTQQGGEVVSIQCLFSKDSIPCGPKQITISQCVAMNCCWNPALAQISNSNSCIRPTVTTLTKAEIEKLAKERAEILRKEEEQEEEKKKKEQNRKNEHKAKVPEDEVIPNGNFGVFVKTCRVKENRKICDGDVKNREDCKLNSCCWDESLDTDEPLVACHAPKVNYKPVSKFLNKSEDSSIEWSQVDLEEIRASLDGAFPKNPDDDYSTMSVSPATEFFYDGFSVTLTCPDHGEGKEKCGGGYTREECLSLYCCWVKRGGKDSTCVKPTMSFAQEPSFAIYTLDNTYPNGTFEEPDFWRPSLPEKSVQKNEEVVTMYCPSEVDEVINCGNEDISTRDECVASGCCWRPWFILRGKNQPACQAPSVILENIASILTPDYVSPTQSSVAYWEYWSEWSNCRSLVPCSVEGRQYRDRYCRSLSGEQLTKVEDLAQCTGAAFEVRSCYNITGCDATSWSRWTQWTQCSESCQSGRSIRTRTCQPIEDCPIDLDATLPATEVDERQCNMEMCEVWDLWIENNDCDADCEGNGTYTKYRTCKKFTLEEGRFNIVEKITIFKSSIDRDLRGLVPSQPETFFVHPQECIVQTVPCKNEDVCTYEWDDWSEWTDCNSHCGFGTRSRHRGCFKTSAGREPVVAANTSCSAIDGGLAVMEEECGEGRCQNWGEWKETMSCNAECEETGIRYKERKCLSGSFDVFAQPKACFKTEERCRGQQCPLYTWDRWGSWSTCTRSCSPGLKTRARRCMMRLDSAWVDSDLCEGSTIETEKCNENFCKIWGNWTEGNCEASCGKQGLKKSRRLCIDEEFEIINETSVKKSSELYATDIPPKCFIASTKCLRKCEIRWEEWGQWSVCSAKCTQGRRKRFRRCMRDDGVPFNKRHCLSRGETETEQTESCNVHMCKKWTSWVKSECVGQCKSSGSQTGERTCMGRDMEWLKSTYQGEKSKCYRSTFPCIAPCAQWDKWGNFSECSDTCGPGSMTRERLCVRGNTIVPQSECSPTTQKTIEVKPCNIFLCSSYSEWKHDYYCEGKCGQKNATKRRTRECYSGIAPDHCLVEKVPCRPRCGAGWGPWGTWSECNEKCGPGTSNRTRECMNGDEVLNPKVCERLNKKDKKGNVQLNKCNLDFCNSWSKWQRNICPAKCGEQAVQRRNRFCMSVSDSPEPLDCWSDLQKCTGGCVATWGPWTSWAPCTSRCGPGKQTSVRRCTQNGIVVNPRLCEKNKNKKPQVFRKRGCYTEMCDNWSKWKTGPCTVLCGGSGTATKTRECLGKGVKVRPDDPSDHSCFTKQQQCGTSPCPGKYEPWSQWTACSSICSPGNQKRTRKCVRNGFAYGDCSSLGPAVATRSCNMKLCSKWRPWEFASACSKKCGAEGTRQRRRTCEDTKMTETKVKRLHRERCYKSRVTCASPKC